MFYFASLCSFDRDSGTNMWLNGDSTERTERWKSSDRAKRPHNVLGFWKKNDTGHTVMKL